MNSVRYMDTVHLPNRRNSDVPPKKTNEVEIDENWTISIPENASNLSIIIFLTGPDMTRHGPLDVNRLIHRAADYGLYTYLYSYLDGFKHPDDPDADTFFDSTYGELFKSSPEAKGIILVSESCEFPTKDPRACSVRTTPDSANPFTQGICGYGIIHPAYFPEMIPGGTACGRMMHEDIKNLEKKVLPAWHKGVELMKKAVEAAPENKKGKAEKILGVGEFFGAMLMTLYHTKKWFILNRKIEIEPDLDAALGMIEEMKEIVDAELENARNVLPYADNDSVLGWEPRMDYVGGAWHLRWKIKQLENLRAKTLVAYAKTLSLNPPL